MITRAITANKAIDYTFGEIRSIQSMIDEKITAQNSNQNTSAFREQ